MKITDVTITLFMWDTIPVVGYSAMSERLGAPTQMGLLTIRTDEGVEGYAVLGTAGAGAEHDAPSLIERLKPRILGRDPLQREAIWQTLMLSIRGTTYRAIGAIDVALWDIAGKVAGLPIYKLLGGYRTEVPAYASSPAFPTAEEYAAEAVSFKERGWTAYKIHPPTLPDADIKVCATVRDAVGEDYVLMLDSMWSYDYPTALRVGRAIEEMGYYWYEDPLADDDIYGYVKLKEKLDIPIMATEHNPGGFTAYAPWLVERATDYLRGDVAVKGGITAIVKAAHLAEAFHMNYEIHHGGNSLNNVANLHALMAIRNSEYFEVILPDAAHKSGLIEDITVGADGLVRIAPFDKPGLGAEIDFAMIERKTIARLG